MCINEYTRVYENFRNRDSQLFVFITTKIKCYYKWKENREKNTVHFVSFNFSLSKYLACTLTIKNNFFICTCWTPSKCTLTALSLSLFNYLFTCFLLLFLKIRISSYVFIFFNLTQIRERRKYMKWNIVTLFKVVIRDWLWSRNKKEKWKLLNN